MDSTSKTREVIAIARYSRLGARLSFFYANILSLDDNLIDASFSINNRVFFISSSYPPDATRGSGYMPHITISTLDSNEQDKKTRRCKSPRADTMCCLLCSFQIIAWSRLLFDCLTLKVIVTVRDCVAANNSYSINSKLKCKIINGKKFENPLASYH